MQSNKSILLIGYDANLCLGLIYCLKTFHHNFYLLTWNRKNAAKFSKFIKKTYYYDDYDHLEDQVIDIIKAHQIDLIMPYDELEGRWVKENTGLLSQYCACMWGTELDYFDIGINKKRLAEFLTVHHLPCPKFATVTTAEELQAESSKIGFPLLVKPTRSNFGRGIKKFETWEDLKAFYDNDKEVDKEYIIQPFIIGSDITCNVICKEGEVLCHTIQESPVKYGSNFSSNDILIFHDDEQVIDTVSRMMKLLHWNGVACVDIRRDHKDQSILILEINGRFWASVVSSCIRAGINFPEIMASLALGEIIDFPRQRPAHQISLSQYFKNKLSFKKASFKDTKYISYLADPAARLMQLISR
jgi:predicted ATP-grasp superfamily ATP-dependent carboligase